MTFPPDYVNRVYAGVLGKIIGVYLGRPFEQWPHEKILAELGEINYYVHEKRGVPLIVSDDDISGTFTFIRALEDYGYSKDITPRQIGQTWLNYIIENRTILWWGGMGTSTEHTAYIRLKNGIPAPRSGSMETNSRMVAEQIGSQIFIDGWAMVSPGDAQQAADLARKAASVSHDGEAIFGAQVIAVMEAMAFVEKDLGKLLDLAMSFIPKESTIHQLIDDLRKLRETEPDWHKGLAFIHEKYSYEKYGNGCHIVPNHAVIMLGLLWGDDDFQKSLMITNTAGYDTDCNSGNVGCILGIKNGLAGIDAGPDWRGPVADRLLLPTADGGRCISDAAIETYHLVRTAMALAGRKFVPPKKGARFHFDLPGSVQGFTSGDISESRSVVTIENVAGHSKEGQRSLAVRFQGLATGNFARVATPTFLTLEQSKVAHYAIPASPTLYPGQTMRARVSADESNAGEISAGLYLRHYDGNDGLVIVHGPALALHPGENQELNWTVPSTDGQPIAGIGLEISSAGSASGCIYLDYLTWDGSPDVVLKFIPTGTLSSKAWVDGMSTRMPWAVEQWSQTEGRGLLIQGTREWTDYRVSTQITSHMVKAAGLAARVQGMKRYYALLLCNDGTAKFIKALDGDTVLGSKAYPWELTQPYHFSIEARGNQLRAWINDELLFDVTDADRSLVGGAIAMVCEEGRGMNGPVTIVPV